MATLIPFPTDSRVQTPKAWSARLRDSVASTFMPSTSAAPSNIDWSLMEHLATQEEEGDSPRAA